MTEPFKKGSRIGCVIEEALPNYIFVTHKVGSRIFRGVLVDERCSHVKRVRLQERNQVSKPQLTTTIITGATSTPKKVSGRHNITLRSSVPKSSSCIVLDDYDLSKPIAESPINSIRGLVERIECNSRIEVPVVTKAAPSADQVTAPRLGRVVDRKGNENERKDKKTPRKKESSKITTKDVSNLTFPVPVSSSESNPSAAIVHSLVLETCRKPRRKRKPDCPLKSFPPLKMTIRMMPYGSSSPMLKSSRPIESLPRQSITLPDQPSESVVPENNQPRIKRETKIDPLIIALRSIKNYSVPNNHQQTASGTGVQYVESLKQEVVDRSTDSTNIAKASTSSTCVAGSPKHPSYEESIYEQKRDSTSLRPSVDDKDIKVERMEGTSASPRSGVSITAKVHNTRYKGTKSVIPSPKRITQAKEKQIPFPVLGPSSPVKKEVEFQLKCNVKPKASPLCDANKVLFPQQRSIPTSEVDHQGSISRNLTKSFISREEHEIAAICSTALGQESNSSLDSAMRKDETANKPPLKSGESFCSPWTTRPASAAKVIELNRIVTRKKVIHRAWIRRRPKKDGDSVVAAKKQKQNPEKVCDEGSSSMASKSALTTTFEKNASSTADEVDASSMSDDKDAASMSDEKDAASISDEKDASNISGEKEASSTIDNAPSLKHISKKDEEENASRVADEEKPAVVAKDSEITMKGTEKSIDETQVTVVDVKPVLAVSLTETVSVAISSTETIVTNASYLVSAKPTNSSHDKVVAPMQATTSDTSTDCDEIDLICHETVSVSPEELKNRFISKLNSTSRENSKKARSLCLSTSRSPVVNTVQATPGVISLSKLSKEPKPDKRKAQALAAKTVGAEKIVRFTGGDVVWGKVYGHPWWPGRVIKVIKSTTGSSDIRDVHVAWFGSTTQSTISSQLLLPFAEHFKAKFVRKKTGPYRTAVNEARRVCKLMHN